MTTYNGERFLAKQLDSLGRQSRLPLELVVGDDGSTDGTLALLKKFALSAPFPVHVLVNTCRLGFANNFLTTARRALGELVAFCDQDDVWHPDKLHKVEAAMSTDDILLCVHKAWLIDEMGQECGEFANGIRNTRVAQPLDKRYWPLYYGFTVTVRKVVILALLEYMQQPDGSLRPSVYAHDGWVTFVSAISGRICELEDKLVGYRQHGANAVGVRPARERFSTAVELQNNIRYSAITLELIDYLRFHAGRVSGSERDELNRVMQIYLGVLKHVQTKNDTQSAESFSQALRRLIRHTLSGDYQDPYSASFRFRSFAHDFFFILRRFLFEPSRLNRSTKQR